MNKNILVIIDEWADTNYIFLNDAKLAEIAEGVKSLTTPEEQIDFARKYIENLGHTLYYNYIVNRYLKLLKQR